MIPPPNPTVLAHPKRGPRRARRLFLLGLLLVGAGALAESQGIDVLGGIGVEPIERKIAGAWLARHEMRALEAPRRDGQTWLEIDVKAVGNGCKPGLLERINQGWLGVRRPYGILTVESLGDNRVVHTKRFRAVDIGALQIKIPVPRRAGGLPGLYGIFMCGDRQETQSCFAKDPMTEETDSSTEFDRIWHFTPLHVAGSTVATGDASFLERLWPWTLTDDPYGRRQSQLGRLTKAKWAAATRLEKGRVRIEIPRTSVRCTP